MECWYNQNWSSSIGQSVPRTTNLTDAGLRVRVSKESHVTCRVCACSCVLTCVHMMKVWAAEGSEWSRCQTLTSCGFSCPSLGRYLKFDSDPQISHVAYICTEIPPRSIGCFEMDVNMNLLAIYLRPFGGLYSVTALQGHRRVFNLSRGAVMEACLSHHRWSVWNWVKDKGREWDCSILPSVLTLHN